MSKLEAYVNQAIADFDSIEAAIRRNGVDVPKGTDTKDYGTLIDIVANPQTYILQDEDGNEVAAVLVESSTVFTATENDIRAGTVAATSEGVTTGTKVIPSYHTTEGYRIITSGSKFETVALTESDKYDFTKLQVIICPYVGSIAQSVAAEKVAIDEGVYATNSTELLANVTRNAQTKTIDLGIVNETDSPYVLRYFTYKEIY